VEISDLVPNLKRSASRSIRSRGPGRALKTVPAQIGPAQIDPAKVDPAKVDPDKVDPAKSGHGQGEDAMPASRSMRSPMKRRLWRSRTPGQPGMPQTA